MSGLSGGGGGGSFIFRCSRTGVNQNCSLLAAAGGGGGAGYGRSAVSGENRNIKKAPPGPDQRVKALGVMHAICVLMPVLALTNVG